MIFLNKIDREFYSLADKIQSSTEKEIYYQIRKNFDLIPEATKTSCMNFFNQFGYWGLLNPKENNYEEIELKEEALYHHMEDFIWVYEHLADYRSKSLLFAILNNWYSYDFLQTTKTKEYLFDDYFDLDLVKCDKNEVIVDLGAYTGDTVLSYIQNYGEDFYQKIYCYEITPESFDILKQNLKDFSNIEFRFKGVGSHEGKMRLEEKEASSSANSLTEDSMGNVEVVTLDGDIKEKITLIKADIEGYEQQAILGAKNHIINDHPKLLISVYHNNEDLWKIPKMIHEMDSSYQFYLRYHSSPIYPTEITLIAL